MLEMVARADASQESGGFHPISESTWGEVGSIEGSFAALYTSIQRSKHKE